MTVISVPAIAAATSQAWRPVDVATANDAIVRLARLDGEFDWHTHDEDELFLCWEGAFRIELRGLESVELGTGDVFVVSAGVEHRPVADRPAVTLLIERPETEQRG